MWVHTLRVPAQKKPYTATLYAQKALTADRRKHKAAIERFRKPRSNRGFRNSEGNLGGRPHIPTLGHIVAGPLRSRRSHYYFKTPRLWL